MLKRIDSITYSATRKYRERQAEPLWDILRDIRGKDVDHEDNLFDIGCGGLGGLRVWERKSIEKRPRRVVGFDIYQEPVDNFSKIASQDKYICALEGFWKWSIPDEMVGRFNLVTAVNSWHWIVIALTDSERNTAIYEKAAKLLQEDGMLAILHRLSPDPCPEVTQITLSALKRIGVDLEPEKYDEFRRDTWKIPENLAVVQDWAIDAKGLNEILALQTTTWQSVTQKDLWPIWSSVNLPAFCDYFNLSFNQEQKKALQHAFESLELDKLPSLTVHKPSKLGEPVRVLLTMHAAVQILRKESHTINKKESGNLLYVDASAPNRVRRHVSRRIDSFLGNDPWFGETRIVVMESSNSNSENEDHDSTLQYTLQPLVEALKSAGYVMESVALRSSRDRNQYTVSLVSRINKDMFEEELKYLLKKKRDDPEKFLTFSELVFEDSENSPPALCAFVGDSWSGFERWKSYSDGMLTVWIRGSTDLICDYNVLLGENPGDVLHAYWLECQDVLKLPQIADFLWFLINQEKRRKKRFALCISSCRSLAGSAYKDSVSITVVPPEDRLDNIADYNIIADALQVYAQVQEAVDSRTKQRDEFLRWMALLGHEATKDWSSAAELLTPGYFTELAPHDKKRILAYCKQLFVSANLWTFTHKDELIRGTLEPRDLSSRYIKQTLERHCKSVWQTHCASRATREFLILKESERKKQFGAYSLSPVHVNLTGTENAHDWDNFFSSGSNDHLERIIADYFGMIIASAVRNACKHSYEKTGTFVPHNPIVVSLNFPISKEGIVISVTNTHNMGDSVADEFCNALKDFTSHERFASTFAVIHLLMRELLRIAGCTGKPSELITGEADKYTAHLNIIIPISKKVLLRRWSNGRSGIPSSRR